MKYDDAAAASQPPGRLAQEIECTPKVDGNHLIEGGVVHLADRRQVHDASVVHDDVEAPEVLVGHTEHRLHGSGIPNIARNGDRSATTLLD